MKTLYIIILTAVSLLTSCSVNDIKMQTTIHEDGTCVRELWFKTDSASLVNPEKISDSFVQGVLNNDDWTRTWLLDNESEEKAYPMTQADYAAIKALGLKKKVQGELTDDGEQVMEQPVSVSDTVRVHAKREFASVGEMAEALPFFLNGQQIRSKATLEKHFHWFYTDYVYSETFEGLASQFDLPITDFMDANVASYCLTGNPNIMEGKSMMEMKDQQDRIEMQFYIYYEANVLNDAAKLIIEHYDQLENAPMNCEEFMARRDAYIRNLQKLSRQNQVNNELELDGGKLLTMVYENDFYERELSANEALRGAWEQRQNFDYSLIVFDVDYLITMPGGIVNILDCQNCVFAADNELHSHLTGLRLQIPDYTIRASSSVKNTWAIMLSLLIGLLAIGLLVSKMLTKRTTTNND